MKRFALGALLVLVACGGGSGSREPAEPTGGGGDADARRAEAEQRLAERQFAACEALGPHITACAVADARAHADELSEEDRAALDDEAFLEAFSSRFIDQCKGGELSARQVKVLETCAASPPAEPVSVDTCEPFLACLDGVQKKD